MSIRIGDNSDPRENPLCAVATAPGAYRCNLKGKWFGIVGRNPGDKWKIRELMAFDTFLPTGLTASSSGHLSAFPPSNSLIPFPRNGRKFDSATISGGGSSYTTNYKWTELSPCTGCALPTATDSEREKSLKVDLGKLGLV